MRIAFVSIPRFPCVVEVQRNPRLARAPLIIGDAEQPKRVLDCSPEASEKRVCSGMTIAQALGLCPDAIVIPPDPVLYSNVWEVILEALEDITPDIEDEEFGCAYLDVKGLQLHYRDEAQLCEHILRTVKESSGLEAAIGLADGKFFARAASSTIRPPQAQVIDAGTEARFLAPLNIQLLPLEADVISRLSFFGLNQISDIAAFSFPELQSQFGPYAKRLFNLVNGLDDEPLKARIHPETLQETATMDMPVAGTEVLVAIAHHLLSRLRLGLQGRAVRELTLQAELSSGRGWQHRLVLREPVSEDERLAFIVRSALTNFPPPQATHSLSLRLGSLARETGKQLSLAPNSRRERQLQEAILQLKTRYGHSPVYRCVDVESWSVVPEERQILVESDV